MGFAVTFAKTPSLDVPPPIGNRCEEPELTNLSATRLGSIALAPRLNQPALEPLRRVRYSELTGAVGIRPFELPQSLLGSARSRRGGDPGGGWS